MPPESNTKEKCPHCEFPVKIPPEQWRWSNPWQCQNCGGMFGLRMHCQRVFAVPAELRPLWPLFTWMEARRFGFFANGKHYVYAICYPNGLPFYVGRGRKLRVCQHVEETWRLPESRLKAKHLELMALADANESEWYHFMALVSDQAQAADIEQAYVKKWRLDRQGGLLLNSVVPDGSPDSEQVDLDEVAIPDTSMAVNNEGREERRVLHPELFDGNCGCTRRYTCGICREFCLVPEKLISKIVQCPNCAHLFLPVVDGWAPRETREFEESISGNYVNYSM